MVPHFVGLDVYLKHTAFVSLTSAASEALARSLATVNRLPIFRRTFVSLTTTERDSNSASPVIAATSRTRSRANGNDERPFQGGIMASTRHVLTSKDIFAADTAIGRT